MSDTNNRPLPDGSLRGDDKPMPMRGNTTGLNGGYSLPGQDGTTSFNRFNARSDDAEDSFADDPLHPDADDDMGGSGAAPASVDATGSMGSIKKFTQSDAPDECYADDPIGATKSDGAGDSY